MDSGLSLDASPEAHGGGAWPLRLEVARLRWEQSRSRGGGVTRAELLNERDAGDSVLATRPIAVLGSITAQPFTC